MSAETSSLPEGAELLEDGSGKVRYTLKWPVTYRLGNSEQTIAEVIVRRKNLADNLAIKAMTLDADVAHALAHRLTGLDSKIVQQFDDVDMNALARIVESFTTPGQSTPTAAPG